jgi:hypothetical protein
MTPSNPNQGSSAQLATGKRLGDSIPKRENERRTYSQMQIPGLRERRRLPFLSRAALLLGMLLAGPNAQAAWTGAIDSDVWLLPSTRTTTLWLVIHRSEAGETDGLHHVEVLERRLGAKPWQIRRVAAHMAVRDRALRASILRPLNSGAVYPEAFDYAYAEWQRQRMEGKGFVCESNVIACLSAGRF